MFVVDAVTLLGVPLTSLLAVCVTCGVEFGVAVGVVVGVAVTAVVFVLFAALNVSGVVDFSFSVVSSFSSVF